MPSWNRDLITTYVTLNAVYRADQAEKRGESWDTVFEGALPDSMRREWIASGGRSPETAQDTGQSEWLEAEKLDAETRGRS